MTTFIPDFSTARVLVVGDIMLDKYWHGSTLKISPEAPVPIVKVDTQDYRAGGAGNVALNIASLGGHAILLGLVGDDDAAHQLQRCLTCAGLTPHLLTAGGKQTITKLRIVSQRHQMIRLDFEDRFADVDHAPLDNLFLSELNTVNAVVLSDYAKGTLKNPARLINDAKMRGLPVIVDPKSKDFEIYRGATILTPNLAEFEAAAGVCHDEQTLISKAKSLAKAFDFEALLVTRGEQGMILVGQSFEPVNFPIKATQVSDVTGAGDTVVATLASALAVGQTFADAVTIANLAAGLSVEKFGTASITSCELMTAIEKNAFPTKGPVTEEQLVYLVKQAKLSGQRIVMTNGCFDIIHPGHVSYLANARELGDKLIVAVNDDQSVRALKGAGRPLNSLNDRMLMLSSLKSVDWVISFSESTPERLIRLLCPDVLVKGRDYSIDAIAGGEYVKSHGGEVLTLDLVQGHSTTALIKKIQQGLAERDYT